MPDYERAGRIGEFYGNPKTRTFAELLIDCEEDKYLRRYSWGCCERQGASTCNTIPAVPGTLDSGRTAAQA